jgi:hypothetical protein
MEKLVFLMALGAMGQDANSFVEGLASGYGLGSSCISGISSTKAQWSTFVASIGTSRGTGNALFQFHDFTLSLSQTATTCTLLEIANLLDQAFYTNLLSTIIRMVANYSSIYASVQDFINDIKYGAYGPAGNDLGQLIKYIIG